ncbi:MAG: carbohydrate binding domain-containing protein [Saprospiraceae bacterium]
MNTQNKIATLFLTLCCLLVLASSASAQGENMLQNPSFEDERQCCKTPSGWRSCGPNSETQPDIQPGAFGVYLPPQHGESYLGMVVRNDGTTESVLQELRDPMKKGHTYKLSTWAAKSNELVSYNRKVMDFSKYEGPVILKIYGGNLGCQKYTLLATSIPIENKIWENYNFMFTIEDFDFSNIIFEVSHVSTSQEYYNGNLLLDNCSLTQVK